MRYLISHLQRLRDVVRRKAGLWLFDKKKAMDFELTNTQSILFIRNDAKLGDAIVSSGVIKKIKSNRPDIKIKVLTTNSMASLFSEHFGVDQVIHLSKRPSYREIKQVCEQVGPIDVVASLNLDMKMKDIYLLSQLKSKVNVGVDSQLSLINYNVLPDVQNKHYADKFDYIASVLGINGPAGNYIVPIRESSIKKAEEFLTENKINDFILINPFGSGSERKLSKSSINKIVAAVEHFSQSLPMVFLTAPDTRALLDSMSIEGSQVYHFDRSESIFDAIAMVAKSRLVISVDTSIVHIATGMNKLQVAIYSSDETNYKNWHPNSHLAKVVVASASVNEFSDDVLLTMIQQQLEIEQ
ncbi:glycosyltransferase family 9 protein [Vibrio cholerae]|uniref:glycosyltransferase family 9 protein n=1 Tax=Vibrio TaxID=662 RepID=UPI00028DE640|nr:MULTISPECIES: glycosyltransferase family 9 protein [Vibrio]EKG91355.1 rfaF protein [Vibrio paracholerae HE-16]MEB5520081.1 lipopolysaccharide heptosyltransferase family protein [Vibrio cholerae]